MGIKKIEQFIFEEENQQKKDLIFQNRISQIITSPDQIDNREYDIKLCTELGKYYYILERFEETLKEKLNHCNHSSFYQNISTLKFKIKNNLIDILYLITNHGLNGTYHEIENRIKIYEKKIKNKKDIPEFIKLINEDTINHELLHMASRKKQGNTIYCGFHMNSSKFSFGCGLNEGYTEHLNLKYFSDMLAVKSYPKEMLLSVGIERIIGTEKMEQLYFEADMAGLIKELEEYTTRENAISIIHQIDKLSESMGSRKETLFLDTTKQIAHIIERKEGANLFSTYYKNANQKTLINHIYEEILIKNKEKFQQMIFESLMKEEQELLKIYQKQEYKRKG